MEIEKELGDKDLIVSSTNKKGIIAYVNSTFTKISEYTKDDLYGQPHNIVRHPDMPKAIFKYIWENLLNNKPVVAYVKNYVKGNQKYYWVKAVMYPKIVDNEITMITSYRTKATSFEISQISEIYIELINYEKTHNVSDSLIYFKDFLKNKTLTYNKLINRLNDKEQVLNTALLNLNIFEFKSDHMIFRSRIESLVEKGYKNIEVIKSTCCKFGKRLENIENESFSKDSRFIEIKRLHDKVHTELEEYVNAEESVRFNYMNEIYKDIDTLFGIMEDLKNDHKYDFEV